MTNFTDPIYSHAFVARVNDELATDKTALQIWRAVHEHLYRLEGYQWLDTAPRDYLMCIMDERELRGFDRLAKRLGYIPRGKKVWEYVEQMLSELP